MRSRSAIRLVIADTQEVFREGLKSVLGDIEWITVVGEADDEPGLLDQLQFLDADMILVDLAISGTTDPHVIQRLRNMADHLFVIVITAGHESDRLRKALQLGADGFLLRETDSVTFLDALRKVADGHHYIQSELAARLVGLSVPSSKPVGERLSGRQLRVLQLLTRGSGNRQIAREMGISETTVKSELRFIYAELEAASRAEAAAIALRIGLVD
ncbi:MAG TPA: response regulator transcription factor [Acidimicrobiia bacterium]